MNKELVFTGAYREDNWFYKKYYYSGANFRYHTFSLVLNVLNQKHKNPTILETGCQRQIDDLGGGMSTSIFAEYIYRYGGNLVSVDLSPASLNAAHQATSSFQNKGVDIKLVQSDSVKFLQSYEGPCDLLYLDSYDYPIGHMINKYGHPGMYAETEAILWKKNPEELIKEFTEHIIPCQEHAVNEFMAMKDKLKDDTILLIDDNLLPGGGKPRLVKEVLPDYGWICLLDFQQSLWVKRI